MSWPVRVSVSVSASVSVSVSVSVGVSVDVSVGGSEKSGIYTDFFLKIIQTFEEF
jgi:hypothetical protein